MRSVALLLAGCLLNSCATMTRGRNEVISVDSNPSGAKATILCAGNIAVSGTTPARLTIPRKADLCRVDVEQSGMVTQKIQIERGFNGAYWCNFIPTLGLPIYALSNFSLFASSGSDSTAYGWMAFGVAGLAGLVVDRVTGAMYDHDPHVIKVTLQPEH
jgi:hypothetical protein